MLFVWGAISFTLGCHCFVLDVVGICGADFYWTCGGDIPWLCASHVNDTRSDDCVNGVCTLNEVRGTLPMSKLETSA